MAAVSDAERGEDGPRPHRSSSGRSIADRWRRSSSTSSTRSSTTAALATSLRRMRSNPFSVKAVHGDASEGGQQVRLNRLSTHFSDPQLEASYVQVAGTRLTKNLRGMVAFGIPLFALTWLQHHTHLDASGQLYSALLVGGLLLMLAGLHFAPGMQQGLAPTIAVVVSWPLVNVAHELRTAELTNEAEYAFWMGSIMMLYNALLLSLNVDFPYLCVVMVVTNAADVLIILHRDEGDDPEKLAYGFEGEAFPLAMSLIILLVIGWRNSVRDRRNWFTTRRLTEQGLSADVVVGATPLRTLLHQLLHRDRALTDRLLKKADLALGDVIGSGSFGEVRRGVWHGMDVAVKQITSGGAEDGLQSVLNESAIMHRVSNHRNVVQFIGVCPTDDETTLLIVSRFMSGGSLDALVYRSSPRNQRARLPEHTLVEMAIDAANGVIHLHQCGVVHRDLACRNLLVDENHMVAVADFGFARGGREEDDQDEGGLSGTTLSRMGPIKWEAPECWSKHKAYSEKSDVWSFGVVLYEMLTGLPPWEGLTEVEAAHAVMGGQRMDLSGVAAGDLRALMMRCFDADPELRPTMVEVRDRLQEHLHRRDDYALAVGKLSLQTLAQPPESADHEYCDLESEGFLMRSLSARRSIFAAAASPSGRVLRSEASIAEDFV